MKFFFFSAPNCPECCHNYQYFLSVINFFRNIPPWRRVLYEIYSGRVSASLEIFYEK